MVTHTLSIINIEYVTMFGVFNKYVRDENYAKYEFKHVPTMNKDRHNILEEINFWGLANSW